MTRSEAETLLARMDAAFEELVQRSELDPALWSALEAPPSKPVDLGGGVDGSDSSAGVGDGGVADPPL